MKDKLFFYKDEKALKNGDPYPFLIEWCGSLLKIHDLDFGEEFEKNSIYTIHYDTIGDKLSDEQMQEFGEAFIKFLVDSMRGLDGHSTDDT